MRRLLFLIALMLVSLPSKGQWHEVDMGLDKPRLVEHLSSPSEDVVWATLRSPDGLTLEYLRSTDGGETWKKDFFDKNIRIHSLRPSDLEAVGPDTAWVTLAAPNTLGGGLIVTFDGGQSWQGQSLISGTGVVEPVAVHFYNDQVGVAIGKVTKGDTFKVYRTTNAGNDWQRIPRNQLPTPMEDEVIDSTTSAAGSQFWIATSKGRVLYSLDSGRSWKASETGLDYIFTLSFNANGFGLANNFSRTFVTRDSGHSWSSFNRAPNINFTELASVPGSNVFVATQDDVQGSLVSTSKGKRWEVLEDSTNITTVAFPTACSGWAGSFNYDTLTGELTGSVMYKWHNTYTVQQPQKGRLEALAELADYQWLSCGQTFMPIEGETSREFIPDSTGRYAVEVTQYGCVDTSACFQVNNIAGLSENGQQNLSIYPNPAQDQLQVTLPEALKGEKLVLTITNGTGQQKKFSRSVQSIEQTIELAVSDLPRGIYFLQIQGGQQSYVQEFAKH